MGRAALEEALGRNIYSDWSFVRRLGTDGRPLEAPSAHGFPERLRWRGQGSRRGLVGERRGRSRCADRGACVVLAAPVGNVVLEIRLMEYLGCRKWFGSEEAPALLCLKVVSFVFLCVQDSFTNLCSF